MITVVTIVALLGASLLLPDGHSGGVKDLQLGLQVPQTYDEATRVVRDVSDCGSWDEKEGTCQHRNWQQIDRRFASQCNNKGEKYNFYHPVVGDKCYCFKCW